MIAIIKADFNSGITNKLLSGCEKVLKNEKIPYMVFEVPGAWEIPHVAGSMVSEEDCTGIIALGCIIRGDTYHFEIIANESARGLMDLNCMGEVPIINGILACESWEQAEKRATGDNNKGAECAKSMISMLKIK